MHSKSGHRARSSPECCRFSSEELRGDARLAVPRFRSRDLEQIRPKMGKRILARTLHPAAEQGWLDLESIASVEITSEDKAFPIASALLQRDKGGWRAAEPAIQTIRLIFDEPQRLRRISFVFEETETKRTQEFTLRWSQIGDVPSAKSCGSSGISVRRTLRERRRTTLLTFQTSQCLI